MPWSAGAVCCFLALLAGGAAATELDRKREQERQQRDQRAVFEQGFTELARAEPVHIRDAQGAVRRSGGELALALADRRWTYFHDETARCLAGVIPTRS